MNAPGYLRQAGRPLGLSAAERAALCCPLCGAALALTPSGYAACARALHGRLVPPADLLHALLLAAGEGLVRRCRRQLRRRKSGYSPALLRHLLALAERTPPRGESNGKTEANAAEAASS